MQTHTSDTYLSCSAWNASLLYADIKWKFIEVSILHLTTKSSYDLYYIVKWMLMLLEILRLPNLIFHSHSFLTGNCLFTLCVNFKSFTYKTRREQLKKRSRLCKSDIHCLLRNCKVILVLGKFVMISKHLTDWPAN